MKFRKIDHIGINFNDLPAAKAFFLDLGCEVVGEEKGGGEFLDNVIGLKGAKTEFVMVALPEGGATLELIKYLTPLDAAGIQQAQANTLGIRHITIVVDDVEAIVARIKPKGMELVGEIENYQDVYKLCYVRGPEGIILELAQELK
jgi:catechol 2,3-dioxygenase-like lactoylglutathione lyase family enzyme